MEDFKASRIGRETSVISVQNELVRSEAEKNKFAKNWNYENEISGGVMSESIEKVILNILSQVSSGEKIKNKALEKKTAQVLKTLAYLKATTENKKLGA